jgi:hypothetical protein
MAIGGEVRLNSSVSEVDGMWVVLGGSTIHRELTGARPAAVRVSPPAWASLRGIEPVGLEAPRRDHSQDEGSRVRTLSAAL